MELNTSCGRPREIVTIQYLRGVAALMVVAYHLERDTGQYLARLSLATLQSGVDLFFVMIYSTDGGKIAPWTFMRRRVVRIVPLYWAVTMFMAAILLAAPTVARTATLDPAHLLTSLAFVPSPNPAMHGEYFPLLIPGWTLNLEMFFYVLLAGAIALGRGRTVRVCLIASALLGGVVAYGIYLKPTGLLLFYTQPIVLEFLAGLIIGAAYRRWPIRLNATLGLGIMAAIIATSLCLPGEGITRVVRFGVPAAALLFVAVMVHPPESRLLSLVGDCSYSIYLIHTIVLSALAQIWLRCSLPAGWPLEAAGLMVAVLAGYVCWRFIETPLTTGARRWAGQRSVPVSLRQPDGPDPAIQSE